MRCDIVRPTWGDLLYSHDHCIEDISRPLLYAGIDQKVANEHFPDDTVRFGTVWPLLRSYHNLSMRLTRQHKFRSHRFQEMPSVQRRPVPWIHLRHFEYTRRLDLRSNSYLDFSGE